MSPNLLIFLPHPGANGLVEAPLTTRLPYKSLYCLRIIVEMELEVGAGTIFLPLDEAITSRARAVIVIASQLDGQKKLKRNERKTLYING